MPRAGKSREGPASENVFHIFYQDGWNSEMMGLNPCCEGVNHSHRLNLRRFIIPSFRFFPSLMPILYDKNISDIGYLFVKLHPFSKP